MLAKLVGIVLGVAIIVLAGWAVIEGVRAEPSIVGSLATALAAVVAVVVQRDRENRREVQQAHREQLAPLYEDLFERFYNAADFSDEAQKEFIEKMQRKLVLYGSDHVLARWVTWLRSMPGDDEERDENDPRVLLDWERVLLAIRRDLGHKNEGIDTGDLLRVYVTDIDHHIAAWNARQRELQQTSQKRPST
jgi:hypothetical protein